MFGSKLNGLAKMGFGLALMVGSVIYAQPQDTLANARPGFITMIGDAAAACRQRGVETPLGYIGCNPAVVSPLAGNSVVRIVGGSRFVSARSN